MRVILIVLSVFLFFCCSSDWADTLENSKDTTITLKDSLGNFNIRYPSRYDTFLTWTQESDCNGCGTERYRFQRKAFPIFLESGFYWSNLIDSVDQLTIIHSQSVVINDSLQLYNIKSIHANQLDEIQHDAIFQNGIIYDTIMKLETQAVSIITVNKYDKKENKHTKSLLGSILIKGNLVQIQFTLISRRMFGLNLLSRQSSILFLRRRSLLSFVRICNKRKLVLQKQLIQLEVFSFKVAANDWGFLLC